MPSSQVGQCEEQKYPNWWEQSPGVTPPPPDFNSSIHHCVVTIAGRPGQENRHTHTHTCAHTQTCAHIYKRAPPQTKLPEHMRSFANQLYMQFMRFKQAYTHKHNYFFIHLHSPLWLWAQEKGPLSFLGTLPLLYTWKKCMIHVLNYKFNLLKDSSWGMRIAQCTFCRK